MQPSVPHKPYQDTEHSHHPRKFPPTFLSKSLPHFLQVTTIQHFFYHALILPILELHAAVMSELL